MMLVAYREPLFFWQTVTPLSWYRRLYYGPLRCNPRFYAKCLRPAYVEPMEISRVIVGRHSRCIFYGIPKSASMTIRNMLVKAEDCRLDEMVFFLLRKSPTGGYPAELGALQREEREGNLRVLRFRRFPESRFLQEGPHLEGYFRFSFVRNPWDRLVSCWLNKVASFLRNRRYDAFEIWYPNVPLDSEMSFDDFVRFVCRVPNALCERHIMPQASFFMPGEVDFIGRVETASDDLAYVIQRLDLGDNALECLLQRMHRTEGRKNYTEYYDTELRRLVGERYAEDIERFGYRFGD